MFEAGDAVVHPVRGAGIIVSIEERSWRSERDLFYRIQLLNDPDSRLMVPVEAAEDLGLRPAISSKRLEQVWDVLTSEPTELPSDHRERHRQLQERLRTGDVLAIAKAVRDMAWRKWGKKGLTTRGRRIYGEGLELLAGEIAAAEGVSLPAAETELRDTLREMIQRASDES